MSKLFKSAFIVSAMTLLSRISGLIRDVVFATMLGSGIVSDIFFVAFRIPNLFRRIFAEGAFSMAFVPVFSEYHCSKSDQDKRDFVNKIATYLAISTFIVAMLGVIFAPYVVSIIGMGFLDDPVKFDLTVNALRWTFPYLFFISLTAMSAGILNTYDKFAIPAFTPILLNVCLIIAALLLPSLSQVGVDESVIDMQSSYKSTTILAIGVFFAGIVQFMFQLPFLKKHAILPRPMINLRKKTAADKGVKQVGKLMIPTIFGASVAQVNIMINTIIATFLATGSVSWLYYSDRLVEFPLGMIGIAISSVILPSLSKEHANSDPERFSHLLNWGLKLGIVIVMPAMFGLFALAEPVLTTLFMYNAFTAFDVEMTSLSLRAYSLGLLALVTIKILAPGFYARQDTKTPVKIAVVTLVINSISAIILVQYLAHAGLALAVSISSWINAFLLCYILYRKNVFAPDKDWLFFLAKITFASAVMCIGLYMANDYFYQLQWFAASTSFFQRFAILATMVVLGIAVYLALIFVFRINIKQLMDDKSRIKAQ